MSFREYPLPLGIRSQIESRNSSGRSLPTPTVSIATQAFRRLKSKTSGKRLRNARRKVRLSIYGCRSNGKNTVRMGAAGTFWRRTRITAKARWPSCECSPNLTPKPDGGTTLTYEIWATPRNAAGRGRDSVADWTSLSARRFATAFQKYDRAGLPLGCHERKLRQRSIRELPSDRAIESSAIAVSDCCRGDGDARPVTRTTDRLYRARRRFRCRAHSSLRTGRRLDEPRRAVLEICLRATRVGLLDLQWDLLCPLVSWRRR